MMVKDLMITDVVKVYPETPLKELLKKLIDYKIGGVPVVNEQNQLVGFVTDGDALRFIKPTPAQDYNFFIYFTRVNEVYVDETIHTHLDKTVGECMTRSGLVTFSADDSFDTITSALSEHHLKKIPVVDEDQHVVGVLSRGDVVRSIVKRWVK